VDGLGRRGQRNYTEGRQQKEGDEFRNDSHLENNEVDVKLLEAGGFAVKVASWRKTAESEKVGSKKKKKIGG
jgi:hypothetical protein